ncbi:MAG: 30S ribosomal protein S8 [Legionellales bacterium]|nr:30S ribosomal protein S8 [Legionellales bacterium]
MTMQDPIADMLTRVRNAQMMRKREVVMPASNLKVAIATVLKDEGYIVDFSVSGEEAKRELNIQLKYHKSKPVISRIERVSRPGLRSYKASDELPNVMDGLGVAIVSTPKGVMTGKAAKALGHGGEVLCVVA